MDKKRYILAGHCIDGSGERYRKNVLLRIEKGFITAMTGMADLSPDQASDTIDLSHCTIVPPLVDCSVFLCRSPAVGKTHQPAEQDADTTAKIHLVQQHLSYCHMHGLLGVIDNHDISQLMGRYLEQIEEPLVEVRTPVLLTEESTGNTPDGGSFIKLSFAQNIQNAATSPPTRQEYQTLRRQLEHKGQRKAVVIANGEQQVRAALDAGCDAIEQGYSMGMENLRRMAEQNVLWIPNVILAKNGVESSGAGDQTGCRFSLSYAAPGKPDSKAQTFWEKALTRQIEQLSSARQLGVPTATGTGAGRPGILHGESMVEEMKLFLKAGYSLEETIRCASANSAQFFHMPHLGKLTIGQPATFLVTRGSVKQLPRKLSYLEGIYINGLPSPGYRKNPIKAV